MADRKGLFSDRPRIFGNARDRLRSRRGSSASAEKDTPTTPIEPTSAPDGATPLPIEPTPSPPSTDLLSIPDPVAPDSGPSDMVRKYALSMASYTDTPIGETVDSIPVKNYAKKLGVDINSIEW